MKPTESSNMNYHNLDSNCNNKYFHWYMSDSTDGEYLRISDIEIVTAEDYDDAINSWDNVHINDGVRTLVTMKSMLHKTEKSALKYAIKILQKSIRELSDPAKKMAPPTNPEIWIDKASDKLKEFNIIYSEKYPELFV